MLADLAERDTSGGRSGSRAFAADARYMAVHVTSNADPATSKAAVAVDFGA